MTNSNNIPTGPGWWYRDEVEPDMRIVWVSFVTAAGLVSYVSKWGNQYDETNDKWRGPVPKSGEWVSREKHETAVDVALRSFPVALPTGPPMIMIEYNPETGEAKRINDEE